jgi:hypothetical protein
VKRQCGIIRLREAMLHQAWTAFTGKCEETRLRL